MKEQIKIVNSPSERISPNSLKEVDVTYLARYNFAKRFIKENDKVLDVPCGGGYGCKVMNLGYNFFVGVDNSMDAILHSKKFFSGKNNCFLLGDAQRMDFLKESSFDTIVSFEGIEHFKDDFSFLKECDRLLKKTGTFVISTPRRPHGNRFHVREYNLKEFVNLVGKYFKIREVYGQVYDNIIDLNKNSIDPYDYKKFNFILVCSKKDGKL